MSRVRFEAALEAARERQAPEPGSSWRGPGRLVEAIEGLARPRMVGSYVPTPGFPPRAYAFLANVRVEAGVAVGGDPFWASDWLADPSLPDLIEEVGGGPRVRDLAEARVTTCAACGDPTYAVSEEYAVYGDGVVAAVLALCLRCPELAELARASGSCWNAAAAPDPSQYEPAIVTAARSGPYEDTFRWLVRRLAEDWRRSADTQRVYARRKEPGERGLVFWPLELCSQPIVARVRARTDPGPMVRLGTLDEIGRPPCERCGAPAYALGEDRGPDQGGLNYDVYDIDACGQCRHVSTRMVEFAVQYPRA